MIWVLLSIALHLRWIIYQLDISNAFLHGTLEEIIFLKHPWGFEDTNLPNHVCHLKKAIYGLKQAPHQWFATFSTFLLDLNF